MPRFHQIEREASFEPAYSHAGQTFRRPHLRKLKFCEGIWVSSLLG